MTTPNDQRCPECGGAWKRERPADRIFTCADSWHDTDSKPVAGDAARRYLWCRNGMAVNREEIVVPAAELAGEFVAAGDYDALAAERDRLAEELKEAQETTILRDQIDSLMAQVSRLAAAESAAESAAKDARIAELEKQVISGFYEEEVPLFQQGMPTHELQEVVTAEEVTGYVRRIGTLSDQLAACREALRALKVRIHYIGRPNEPLRSSECGIQMPDWRKEIALLEATLSPPAAPATGGEKLANYETHTTRISDASSFDEICTKCGATDRRGSTALQEPCPVSSTNPKGNIP